MAARVGRLPVATRRDATWWHKDYDSPDTAAWCYADALSRPDGYPETALELKLLLSKGVAALSYLQSIQGRRLSTDRICLLTDMIGALRSYWVSRRMQFQSTDILRPGEVDGQGAWLAPTSSMMMWFAQSHGYVTLVYRGIGAEEQESHMARAWESMIVGHELGRQLMLISLNDPDCLVCETPPHRMSKGELAFTLSNLCCQWRQFHYGHLPHLKVLADLLLRRAYVLTACADDSDASPVQSITATSEYEMILFAILSRLNLLAGLECVAFPASTHCEWDAAQFCIIRRRVDAWFAASSKYASIATIQSDFFASLFALAEPLSARERLGRARGVPLRSVSDADLERQSSAMQGTMEILKAFAPKERIGHRHDHSPIRQELILAMLNAYCGNTTYNFALKQTSVIGEADLLTNELLRESLHDGEAMLVQLFNTYVLVMCGEYYPMVDLFDAFTALIIAISGTTRANTSYAFHGAFTGPQTDEEEAFWAENSEVQADLVLARLTADYAAAILPVAAFNGIDVKATPPIPRPLASAVSFRAHSVAPQPEVVQASAPASIVESQPRPQPSARASRLMYTSDDDDDG